jgi:hypothetical protein
VGSTKDLTSQIRFAPIAREFYGEIEFQGSSLKIALPGAVVNISNTAANSLVSPNVAYSFTINGCYQ